MKNFTIASVTSIFVRGVEYYDIAGHSVAGLGDVNADGIGDFAVGIPLGIQLYQGYYIYNAGTAGIYYGTPGGARGDGNYTQIGSSVLLQCFVDGDQCGYHIAAVGDINGDKIVDYGVTGSFNNEEQINYGGQVNIVYGRPGVSHQPLDLGNFDSTYGFIIKNQLPENSALYSSGSVVVSGVNDFNGDGFADIVIGFALAEYLLTDGDDQGAIVFAFGRGDNFPPRLGFSYFDGNNGFVVYGAKAGDGLGKSVASAGDFNGDGFADVVVGAPGQEGVNAVLNAGCVHVIMGRSGPFNASYTMNTLPSGMVKTYCGGNAVDLFGSTVTGGRDVNNDGYSDILVAAPYSDVKAVDSGYAAVIMGSGNPGVEKQSIGTLNGANGFVINNYRMDDCFGTSLAMTPSLDGSNSSEMVIGIPQVDSIWGFAGAGRVLMCKLPTSGYAATYHMPSMEGLECRLILGGQGDGLGYSISSAADLDGDSIFDYIIGAPFNDESRGYAAVIYSSAFNATLAPIEPSSTVLPSPIASPSPHASAVPTSSGFPSGNYSATAMDGYSINSVAAIKVRGELQNQYFGYVVKGLGDFNGDSIPDYGASAPYSFFVNRLGSHFSNAGMVGLFYGIGGGYRADLELGAVNSHFFYRCEKTNSHCGYSISKLGDVNGDGNGDFAIVALDSELEASLPSFTYDDAYEGVLESTSPGGEVQVIFGRFGALPDVLEKRFFSLPSGFTIMNLEVADSLTGSSRVNVAAAGDFNGDGYADIVIGFSKAGIVSENSQNRGEVAVIWGGDDIYPSGLLVSSLNGDNGFVLQGARPGDEFGHQVAAAGDFNGDGIDDIIASAPQGYSATLQPGAGCIYVILGKRGEYFTPYNIHTFATSLSYCGYGVNHGFGAAVDGGRDINNDGYSDVIASAPEAGYVAVIFGNDASEYTYKKSIANLNGNDGFLIVNQGLGEQFGHSIKLAPSHFNNGLSEIIIGIPQSKIGGDGVGNGKVLICAIPRSGYQALYQMPNLEGFNCKLVIGNPGDGLGFSVDASGDIDSDGRGDYILGAPFYDDARGYMSVVYASAFETVPAESPSLPPLVTVSSAPSASPSYHSSASPSASASVIASASISATPSGSVLASPSKSPSPSIVMVSKSATPTPSSTKSFAPSNSATPSSSMAPKASESSSPMPSPSKSASPSPVKSPTPSPSPAPEGDMCLTLKRIILSSPGDIDRKTEELELEINLENWQADCGLFLFDNSVREWEKFINIKVPCIGGNFVGIRFIERDLCNDDMIYIAIDCIESSNQIYKVDIPADATSISRSRCAEYTNGFDACGDASLGPVVGGSFCFTNSWTSTECAAVERSETDSQYLLVYDVKEGNCAFDPGVLEGGEQCFIQPFVSGPTCVDEIRSNSAMHLESLAGLLLVGAAVLGEY